MLEIRQLSKRYANGVQALDGVSLSIGPGLFGLLGPNGAGKSTLMRTLATLQEPDTGSVTLDGLDVLHDKDRVRERVGYLPQEFGVFPRATPVELLDHLAALKGLSDRRRRREVVSGLLEQTNLYAVRHKPLGTFSGGMKQRFGIAQALLGDPQLVIVDEPTAGLDPEERARFHNLLSAIGESVVVLLSTHIVADVAELCGAMAILHGGQVVLSGDPLRLVAALDGRVWQRVVDPAALQELRLRHQVLSTQLLSGRTQVRVLAEEAPAAGFERVAPELEDVYFAAIADAERQRARAGAVA